MTESDPMHQDPRKGMVAASALPPSSTEASTCSKTEVKGKTEGEVNEGTTSP